MSKVYFGFAVADGMFPAECNVTRTALSIEEVKALLGIDAERDFESNRSSESFWKGEAGCFYISGNGVAADGTAKLAVVLNRDNKPYSVPMNGTVISCCNGSHEATVDAMKQRYGFNIETPEKPPHVLLQRGDSIIVMSVRGLARLTESRHYSADEVAAATFVFGLWTVH